MPEFPSGGGGLVSAADDWLAFGQMIAGRGTANGRRVLSPESVHVMTTDHSTPAQREIGELFLQGQGWGYCGSVDIVEKDAWNVLGRYGWIGGTGTAGYVYPASGGVAVLMTQRALAGPSTPVLIGDFCSYAASVLRV